MTAEPAQIGARAETNDDLALVHASKNGDVAAFEQLVKRYQLVHSVSQRHQP
jgi:hypothetical protein